MITRPYGWTPNTDHEKEVLQHREWLRIGKSECERIGNLIGLGPAEYATIMNYDEHGNPPEDRLLLERYSLLLGIYKNLKIIYNNKEIIIVKWFHLENDAFDNKTPKEMMLESKEGLTTVRRYLDKITTQNMNKAE